MRRKGKITKTDPHSLESSSRAQAMWKRKRPENLSIYFPSLSGKGDARDRKTREQTRRCFFARKNLTFIYRCWKHGKHSTLQTISRNVQWRQSRTHVWFAIAPPSLLHHACPSASFQKQRLTSSSNLPNKGATKCEAAAIPMMDRDACPCPWWHSSPFGGDRWKFITDSFSNAPPCSIRHALSSFFFSHSYSTNPYVPLSWSHDHGNPEPI